MAHEHISDSLYWTHAHMLAYNLQLAGFFDKAVCRHDPQSGGSGTKHGPGLGPTGWWNAAHLFLHLIG